MFYVSESNGHSNAEDHEHPVDLRDKNLPMDLVGCVDDFDPRKTTERLTLVYYGERPTDDRLASHHRGKNG